MLLFLAAPQLEGHSSAAGVGDIAGAGLALEFMRQLLHVIPAECQHNVCAAKLAQVSCLHVA